MKNEIKLMFPKLAGGSLGKASHVTLHLKEAVHLVVFWLWVYVLEHGAVHPCGSLPCFGGSHPPYHCYWDSYLQPVVPTIKIVCLNKKVNKIVQSVIEDSLKITISITVIRWMTATKAMERPTRMENSMFQPLWTDIYIYEPYMDFSINKNM